MNFLLPIIGLLISLAALVRAISKGLERQWEKSKERYQEFKEELNQAKQSARKGLSIIEGNASPGVDFFETLAKDLAPLEKIYSYEAIHRKFKFNNTPDSVRALTGALKKLLKKLEQDTREEFRDMDRLPNVLERSRSEDSDSQKKSE